MFGLAIAIALIALTDSLNPTLIAADIYLAARPQPGWRTATFTAAAFLVTLAGGVAIAIGLGDLILSLVPKPAPTLKFALMTAAGVGLLGGGAVIWWRRQSLGELQQPGTRSRPGGGGSAALLGAGLAGVELVTAFPYFAAIAMVVGSRVSAGGKVFLLVLYNVIYALPLIAIAILAAVMGERAGRKLAPVGEWISTHWPVVVAPLAGVAGAALMAYGIVQLA